MALRFLDGFEHYAIPSQLGLKYTAYNDSGSSVGITTITGRRAGSTAIQLRVSIDYISITLDNQQTWYVGFAMNLGGNETTEIARFMDSDGNNQLTMDVTSSGTIRLFRGSASGTQLAVSTQALAANSWNYIELRATIADSGGVFEVRVNEQVWATFTGDTKYSSSLASACRLQFTGRSSKVAIQDLYICDATGGVNNTYLGDVRVDTIKPIGAGALAEFTPQGSASNWDNVDDPTPDADAGYNYSSTVGQRDTFEFGNLSPISGNIFGVQANMAVRKDDAGTRTLRPMTRVDGTNYEGSNIFMSTDYRIYRQTWDQNPSAAAAWTEATINGAEFGYKVQA